MGALGYSAPHSRQRSAVTVLERTDDAAGAVVMRWGSQRARRGRICGGIEQPDRGGRPADPAPAVRLEGDGSKRHRRRIILDEPAEKSRTFARQNGGRL